MFKQNYRVLAILLVFAFLLACAPTIIVTPPPVPTLDVSAINTTIAGTANAAATQTAVLLPTQTPTATLTKTPSPVPSATPTFLYLLFSPTVPTATPTVENSGEPFTCQIVSQSPKEGTSFAPKASFETRVQIMNNGTETWDSNSADFRYIGGDQIHKTAVFDFPKSVATGETVDFTIPMQAPADSGPYNTRWQIAMGKERFCTVTVKIVVKK
jgi:hypothetical protein